jgi:tetratricopeptide (TPR) repeat protein
MRQLVLACLLGIAGNSKIADAQADEHEHGASSHNERLGTVSFANSGSRAAQAPFQRGVALLHSFTYYQAAESFRDAERADPSFALPYWFEAFSHSHILWGEEDTASSYQVLARLGATPEARIAKASTPRERAFGAAIEAFFTRTSDAVRTRAFADSMTSVAARYSGDPEAAAFASLALLMAVNDRGFAPNEAKQAEDRAIALAERVFRTNPTHPGAAHYLIHVTDMDPSFATRALPAARAYAKIAPDAVHALHMPSHVFLPLGLWNDVATSNERAWRAGRAEAAKRHLGGADTDFHTLLWLEYAYLQQGRWRTARALIDTGRASVGNADVSAVDAVDARYGVSDMAFLYAAETGRWNDAVIPPHANGPPRNPREAAFSTRADYARYVIAAMRGDTTTLFAGVADFRARTDAANGPRKARLDMLATQLDALAARTRGDKQLAMEKLRSAASREDSLPPIGPPSLLISHELIGATLSREGNSRDAAAQYERALVNMPNRSAALLGLARARVASGDRVGARETYRRLLENWRYADSNLPALAEARRGAMK